MKDPLNFGEMLSVHARLAPNRLGTRNLDRSMTFAQWNDRSCRLANALLGLGLANGDRVAIIRLQLRRMVRDLSHGCSRNTLRESWPTRSDRWPGQIATNKYLSIVQIKV